MKNFIQPGAFAEYANSSGATLASGAVVQFGSGIAVVCNGIVDGDTGTVALEGVFELSKVSGTAFVQGDKLYWDTTPGELTKTAAGNIPAGIAFAAAGSSDTTAHVKLGDLSDFTPAAHVADASFSAVVTGGTPDCSAAAINTVIGTIQTKINAIITALENAGLMASS